MDALRIFALLALMIIGILLFIYNRKIELQISQDKTVTQTLRDANTGVLIMSVLLITIPITIFMCKRGCPQEIHSTFDNNTLYSIILAGLGITLIVLGAIIQTSKPDLAENSVVIWSSGIGVLVLAFLFSKLSQKVFVHKN